MKIMTIINSARGILSLGILSSIAYFIIKDTVASKGGSKSSRFITTR